MFHVLQHYGKDDMRILPMDCDLFLNQDTKTQSSTVFLAGISGKRGEVC